MAGDYRSHAGMLIFIHKCLWDSGKDTRAVSALVQAYVHRYILKMALLQRECKLCLRLQAKPALQLSATTWTAFARVPKLEIWVPAGDVYNDERWSGGVMKLWG